MSSSDIVQPDLIIVLGHARSIITPKKIKGIPDLVVEILSDSTRDYDRIVKIELYRRAGVAEYWVVIPNDHSVEQYVLRGESYQLIAAHTETVTLCVLEGVSVDLTQAW